VAPAPTTPNVMAVPRTLPLMGYVPFGTTRADLDALIDEVESVAASLTED
jgi:hypothetical protein